MVGRRTEPGANEPSIYWMRRWSSLGLLGVGLGGRGQVPVSEVRADTHMGGS